MELPGFTSKSQIYLKLCDSFAASLFVKNTPQKRIKAFAREIVKSNYAEIINVKFNWPQLNTKSVIE